MNTIPMSSDEGVMSIPDREQTASTDSSAGGVTSRQEYTNEEVSNIIRVALRAATDGGDSTVSHAEMLVIGEEFGLNSEDLQRASEVIASSQDDVWRAKTAMLGFKINFVCYLAGIVGLFLINSATNALSGEVVWWFVLAVAAYFPVVIVHAFIAKFHPEMALSKLHEDGSGEGDEA